MQLENSFKFTSLLIAVLLFPGCNTTRTNTAANNSAVNNAVNSKVETPLPSSTPQPVNTITGDPTPSTKPLPADAEAVRSAIDVVHEYYDAINSKDFKKAYELWSGKGEASKQTFEEFRDGFRNTASVEIDTGGEPGDLEGAAGSQYVTIPLLIQAKTKDGKEQKFWGQYVLRRSMVDGATPEQRSWRIYSAEVRKL